MAKTSATVNGSQHEKLRKGLRQKKLLTEVNKIFIQFPRREIAADSFRLAGLLVVVGLRELVGEIVGLFVLFG